MSRGLLAHFLLIFKLSTTLNLKNELPTCTIKVRHSLSHFANKINNLNELWDFVGKEESADKSRLAIPVEFSKALYTIDIGQNDISVASRMLPKMEQVGAIIPDIINQFAAQLRDLYKKGARNLWIHNAGPIGCLPVATIKIKDPTAGYLDEHGCVKDMNDTAILFNKQLFHTLTKLRIELQQAAITYVDLYKAKYELISNAKNQVGALRGPVGAHKWYSENGESQ
ncbi:GDSL esterase/lipase At5g14450-like isoform X2 [Solanum pennellii]|uniref:GDSL esterase/lipase At5g14450-like isoform X2 n=1 Tax=Solanum pennellii TaxID=28526 RepID=A0ABM1V0E4_SOLPN|nr:GDSL esterase/lipase At5g14450-like isoform X2 [Solanum pennellii]